jgi:hypothetical protein
LSKDRYHSPVPKAVPPTVTPTPEKAARGHEDSHETHPAYGMIGASRVTSSPGTYLLGTDFRHGGFVEITIRHAEKMRSLNADRIHGTDQIIKVALSEAQWAGFVSRLNYGEGVPCTLEWMREAGGYVPAIDMAGQQTRREQFARELDDKLSGVRKDVALVLHALREKGSISSTERARLESIVHGISQNIGGNLQFVADQFGRHLERVTEHAKTEIAAFVDHTVRSAGLDALGSPITLQIDTRREPDADGQ